MTDGTISFAKGRLTRDRLDQAADALSAVDSGTGPVDLDLSGVTGADSAGVALLSVFARKMSKAGRPIRILNASADLEKTLELFPFAGGDPPPPQPAPNALERLGERAQLIGEIGFQYLQLFADTAWFLVTGFFQKKAIRWNEVLYEMSGMGSRAVGVVGLIAFLVGGTMALQSAAQLRQFGANLFVADLVGISMTRELGPLMAAIVVAGRSGSAVAAEIGTMVVTEEIDALRTMGLHPIRFLIVPKVLAITLTQPLLTALANALGIFGGFLVAVLYLDVSPTAFTGRLVQSLHLKDLLTGLFKSVIFAQLIVTIGALSGFRTRGGADAVGRSTTASVVAGIFAVIAADTLASLFFYFGD